VIRELQRLGGEFSELSSRPEPRRNLGDMFQWFMHEKRNRVAEFLRMLAIGIAGTSLLVLCLIVAAFLEFRESITKRNPTSRGAAVAAIAADHVTPAYRAASC
jgi:hypothetical protein